MATYTENYNLKKPAGTDPADIADINGNMDLIDAALAAHTGDKNNPHSVTKAQVGLGNVPNVSTNDQTPTYTEASLLSALESGENLSVAFGKIKKAIGTLISHISSTVNPHSVTKAQVGLGNVPNVSTNDQAPTFTIADTPVQEIASGETLSVIMGKIKRLMNSYISHLSASNPHNISKTTVGLGNVPNVATNDQTPTYTAASSLGSLSSGETISTAFGKIAKAVSDFIAHKSSTSNPHSVTKSQVGLGNVPNVSTNNQTPTYTVATNLAELSSGEALSTAFGKIAKVISSYINHEHSATDITSGILDVAHGGTGSGYAKDACANLNTISLDGPTGEAENDANKLWNPGYYLMQGQLSNVPARFVETGFCNMVVANVAGVNLQIASDGDLTYIRYTYGSYQSFSAPHGWFLAFDGAGSVTHFVRYDTMSLVLGAPINGYLTTSGTVIRMIVPVSKSLANIDNIYVVECVGAIRGVNGYINGSTDSTDWLQNPEVEITAFKASEYAVGIEIKNLVEAFTNGTNNTPVALACKPFTLEFS